MKWKIGLFVATAMAMMGTARPASAQDYKLHYVQAGALLDYADVELRILYAALTAREYDPKITKDTVEELKKTIGEAKRQAGRAATLLPEDLGKHEPKVEKLRAAIGKAEDQIIKLATDIDEQTKSLTEEEGEVELGAQPTETEGDGEPAAVDWDLMKKGCGWLGVDLGAAKRMHRSLARKIKVKTLKAAPKPRGKRPE